MRFRLLVVAIGLTVQAAWGANLGDIYRLARDNDPQYASAREANKAGHEKEPQAHAGLMPSLLLSAFLRQNNVDSNKFGSTDFMSPGLSLALTHPLYRKQNREAYSQGQLQTQQADEQLQAAEQDLLLRSAKAYFDVLQAQDVLSFARAQKAAFAEQLAQAKKSFEVGTATITDTHEAQARYDLTGAQEIAAINDIDVKRSALERLIGRQAPELAGLQDKVVIPLLTPNNMQDWVKRAEAEGVPVQLAQTGLEIARHEVERQRGGHLPTLDLAANYSAINNQGVSGLSGVNTRTGVIGLEFNWPLYQGGLVDSRVREAVANREKARFDLDNARRQAVLDARQGFLGVVSGDAQVKALEQALVSTELQIRSTKLGLEVGVRTRVDVLNAEQLIYSTQRDLSAARYQTLLAALQLKAAVGALGETDLKAIDGLLK